MQGADGGKLRMVAHVPGDLQLEMHDQPAVEKQQHQRRDDPQQRRAPTYVMHHQVFAQRPFFPLNHAQHQEQSQERQARGNPSQIHAML